MKVVSTVLVLCFLLNLSSAQVSLSGKISDNSDSPLPGALVELKGTQNFSSTSDSGGYYFFENLPTGDYQMFVYYLGFEPFSQKIVLENTPKMVVNISLISKSFQLQELVVNAVRAGKGSPVPTSTLDKSDIQKENLGQDVPFISQWTPSVTVTSDAGNGIGYTGIRVRGSDPTRINVTINGIPLNDAESQNVFWVDLPDFLTSTNDIEIQRGVGTSTFGTGAFGASINLNTNKTNQRPYASFNSSIGSFNTFKRNIQFGSGLLDNKIILEGRLSKITSDGYIDRASADLDAHFLSATYLGQKSALKITSFAGHERTYQAWYGVDPSLLNDKTTRTFNPAGTEKPGDPYENQVDDYGQNHHQLHYSYQFSPFWNTSIGLHYTRGKGYFEEYAAAQNRTDYGFSPLSLADSNILVTDLVRRRWLDNHFYGSIFSLQFDNQKKLNMSINAGYNNYDGRHFGEVIWAEFFKTEDFPGRPYYDEDAQKSDFTAFTKMNYQFTDKISGYLDLQFRAINYQFMGFDGQGNKKPQREINQFFNPKAGLNVSTGSSSRIYMFFGIANREPNRYDYLGATIQNPPKPEQLRNVEAGFEKSGKNALLAFNGYYMFYKDQLALNGAINQDGEFTRINLDKSYRLGLELISEIKMGRHFNLNANATLSQNKVIQFNEAIDAFDENFLSLTPISVVHQKTDLAFSPNFLFNGQIAYDLNNENKHWNVNIALLNKYVSRQFIDNTSDTENIIPAYYFSDLRIIYGWNDLLGGELKITLLLRNIFDSAYETNAWSYRYNYLGETILSQGFYPQAGRNFLLGVNWDF